MKPRFLPAELMTLKMISDVEKMLDNSTNVSRVLYRRYSGDYRLRRFITGDGSSVGLPVSAVEEM